MHSDFIASRATREPPFCHSLHFLWCMAHRSLHVVTKVYYRSYTRLCLGSSWYAHNAKFSRGSTWYHCPSCTMRAWANYHGHPHSFEQGTLSTTPLISKQAIPYQTRGGTCCPRVSTPKIRSLPDSSNHIPWYY
jgi:hypothetical protein